jgi:hypothetical protein
MNAIFLLSERGTSFATRTRAEELAGELTQVLVSNPSERLTIDFTGVEVITPSFAVAFISKLGSLLSRPEFRKESVEITGDSILVQRRLLDVFEKHLSFSKASLHSKSAESLERILID